MHIFLSSWDLVTIFLDTDILLTKGLSTMYGNYNPTIDPDMARRNTELHLIFGL